MKTNFLTIWSCLLIGIMITIVSCRPDPTCFDGKQNGGETGIDCGGVCDSICPSGSCFDGMQNGGEQGVDCGGSCVPCPTVASCFDGIQNQDETGVDCGGICPDACTGTTPTCSDGIMNQDETGVDCGGATCPACTGGNPSCSDGMLNQDELAVDCGGVCPACETGQTGSMTADINGTTMTASGNAVFTNFSIPTLSITGEDAAFRVTLIYNGDFLPGTFPLSGADSGTILDKATGDTCSGTTGSITFTTYTTTPSPLATGSYEFECMAGGTTYIVSGTFTDVTF